MNTSTLLSMTSSSSNNDNDRSKRSDPSQIPRGEE